MANLAIMLLILAMLGSRRSHAQPRTGQSVEPVRTGGTPGAAWVAARLDTLRRVGVPEWAQRAVLAHWARETGWGRYEYNGNPGNLRAIGWSGPRVWLRGRDGLLDYRAYPSVEEGARDYWRLIRSSRYRRALELLRRRDAVGWYDLLLRSGYSRWSPQAIAEFASIYERISRR